MRLMFFGPPGSGKGTQAALLCQRLGLTHVSTGEILREAVRRDTPLGRQAKPYMDKGLLVPDDLVNEIVNQRFRGKDRPDNFIMDGYPRTVQQARQFDALLHEQHLEPDAVVFLVVDENELARRLGGRGRADDNEAIIRERLRVFNDGHKDVLDYYRRNGLLVEVPGMAPVETVFQNIIKSIDKKKQKV